MAPTWTKLTYGNRIQDGATVGLEVMGMGHDGYWGCCLLATFCFFLLTFCSWFKWICSLCNNSLTCTHKIHTFFWCQKHIFKNKINLRHIYIYTYIHTHIYIHKVVTSFTEVSYHFLGVNVHATSRFYPYIIIIIYVYVLVTYLSYCSVPTTCTQRI